MNICYVPRLIELQKYEKILKKYNLSVSEFQELSIIKTSFNSVVKSLEKQSVLVVENLSQVGNSFTQVFDNLLKLRELEFTLICLDAEEKVYSLSEPTFEIVDMMGKLKSADKEKTIKLRANTRKLNNSKSGRRSVYNEEMGIVISALKENSDLTVEEICAKVSISKSTYYKHFKNKIQGSEYPLSNK